jgi:hypothetical protein
MSKSDHGPGGTVPRALLYERQLSTNNRSLGFIAHEAAAPIRGDQDGNPARSRAARAGSSGSENDAGRIGARQKGQALWRACCPFRNLRRQARSPARHGRFDKLHCRRFRADGIIQREGPIEPRRGDLTPTGHFAQGGCLHCRGNLRRHRFHRAQNASRIFGNPSAWARSMAFPSNVNSYLEPAPTRSEGPFSSLKVRPAS